jgi:hypothetical protein
LQVIGTKDGGNFFFGDPLNATLVGEAYSIWGLAAGAAKHEGAEELPDLNELFKHVTTTLGNEDFGIPRVPEAHKAGDSPAHYLKTLWPLLLPTVRFFCPNPAEWPVLFGIAIQDAIVAGKEVIDPALALKIVMESAVPMSKVDLARITAKIA